MNEKAMMSEINRSLRRMGYWPITQTDAVTCPRCQSRAYPPKGRPDVLLMHPTLTGAVIEGKVFPRPKSDDDWKNTSFPFSKIEPKQRRWLNLWTQDGGQAYLALGTVHGRISKKEDRRRAWIVPWASWLYFEELLIKTGGVKSLPLTLKPRLRKKVQQHKLTAIRLLAKHELTWVGNRTWELPTYHALLNGWNGEYRDLVAWSKEWRNDE